jgi:hypothetical protein
MTADPTRRKLEEPVHRVSGISPFPGRPALDCSCGYTAVSDTWEEAGRLIDGHLAPFITREKWTRAN